MAKRQPGRIIGHLLLLFLTGITASLAGTQWLNKDPFELRNFASGIPYSLAILIVLLAHELGHYIAARLHRVQATLPFFIPFPSFLFGGLFPFGTLGAVIKLKSPIDSRQTLLDIGSAGPIAGFLASILLLILGFQTLPDIGYLYTIHPEYVGLERLPAEGLTFGPSLAFLGVMHLCAPSSGFVPPMNEIYHYPFLCVGWFGLLVTSMNLIPVGQLDGGHISAALHGDKKNVIANVALVLLAVLGVAGILEEFGLDLALPGWPGWLLWSAMLMFVKKRMPSYSTQALQNHALTPLRLLAGLGCWGILLVSFSPKPLIFVQP